MKNKFLRQNKHLTIDSEMASLSSRLSELELNLKDLEDLVKLAQREYSKEILKVEIAKLESTMADIKKRTSTASKTPTNKCYDVKIDNYAWDQSSKYVKIYATLNKVHSIPTDQVTCQFTCSSFNLRVEGLDNRNYNLVIKNLLDDIDVEKCHWKVKTDMVVVFLKKKVEENWSHVTNLEKKASESKTPKMDTGKDDDPSAGLMNMMKQMYQDGDDEMKRTIAKAWTENQDRKTTMDL